MTGQPSDRLLDLIYDAAADASLWPAVMQGIAGATSSMGGILIGQRLDLSGVEFDYNGGLDPDCNSAYRAAHMQNVWSVEMIRRPPGRLVVSDEIVRLQDLRRTAFYDDVLRPQKVAHNAMCALAVTRGLVVAFNICRTSRQGPPDRQERVLLEHLLVHVRRALALGKRIEGYMALHAAQYQALDALSTGLVLLNASGRVVLANAAASRLIDPSGPLRLRQGSLASYHPALTRRLHDLVGSVIRGRPLATAVFPFPDHSRSVIVTGSSIRSRDLVRLSDGGLGDPTVMLFLTDPLATAHNEAELLRELYGLTDGEARIAAAVAGGAGISAVAQALGISRNTVKTHLSRVFAKTGTTRQTELARLVTAMAAVRARR